ncbi:hypothetical protein N9C07_00930 [Flavobacteriaceae bacterium]|nr:hypothetical protein [Flavobacteriaceae bacterium]
MKKIYLLFVALLVITCAKEEDPIVTPPAVVIPPPSFVIPPVTPPETSTPPSYDGGDISISSREDLDYYREINVQNITGNFELNLDWTYVDNSTSDPSVFTKNIQTVTGDVTINVSVNEEVSLENLLKVGGDYSVTGADVIDDNLFYAQSISLDYEGDYEIKTVYTDAIELNLDDAETAKAFINTSKLVATRSVSITAFHTSLGLMSIGDIDFGYNNISTTNIADSLRETILPTMPEIPVYPSFQQKNSTEASTIESDNVSSITIGGHVNIEKITSESCTEIKINNTELPSIEVVSTSVVTFEMPNLIELVSIILNLPKVDKLEFPLLVSITNISVTGVNEFSSPLLETIKGNFTLSGVSTAGLPKLETLGGTSSLPSNVNLTTGSGAPTLNRTGPAAPNRFGVASSGSGTSSSGGTSSSVGLGNTGDTPHNSGGSGDTAHNSGGSGDSHDSGGSSGQSTTGYLITSPDTYKISSLQMSSSEYSAWKSGDQFSSNASNIRHNLVKDIYKKYTDDYDFIFLVLNEASIPNGINYYGKYISASNDIQGIGLNVFDFTSDYGSGGKLKGIMQLSGRDFLQSGPALHELMHYWGNFSLDTEAPQYVSGTSGTSQSVSYKPHWGYTGGSSKGQLGGFDQSTLEVDGNNYKVGQFGNFANGGNSVPYTKFELYLMGMISVNEVDNFDMFKGVNYIESEGSGDATKYVFTATDRITYTPQSIESQLGARSPNSSSSQKEFKILVVVLTDDPLSSNEWQSINSTAEWFSNKGSDNNPNRYNFWEATGGVGSIVISN